MELTDLPPELILWLREQQIADARLNSAGGFDLIGGQVAGIVAHRGVQIEIDPKLPVNRLVPLIAYSMTGMKHIPEPTEQDSDSFVDLLVTVYAEQLDQALRQGPLRGYRIMEDTSRWFRGRLRMPEQMSRHHMSIQPLEVQYADLTADTAENRILAAACEKCLRLLRRRAGGDSRDKARRLLTRASTSLRDVTPLLPGRPLPAWYATALNTHLHDALHLALLILGDSGVQPLAGDTAASGLLIRMWQLYEGVVERAARESCPDLHVSRQFISRVSPESSHDIRPDVVISRDGDVIGVLDAKYKEGPPTSADLYQMITYATVLAVPAVTLAYASAGEDRDIRITGSDILIRQRHVDLEQPLRGVIDRIAELARESLEVTPSSPAA